MHRREFLQSLGTMVLLSALPESAWAGPKPGALDPEALFKECQQRIQAGDSRLHSCIELLPAPDFASLPQGPLRGIPILLKDNLATLTGTTTAGSLALQGCRTPFESTVARRLRQNGAVFIGKSNMSEWANQRSNNAVSGWSARGGQCRNPHALDRSPCGSSSGSAAAVAAGFVPAAIGTETMGSIVCPAGTCGVVGLKPTHDLVSGDGIIPIAESFDTAGPIARSVKDVAIVLAAMAERPLELLSGLRPDALKGARIGVGRNYFGFDARVDALIESQLEVLSKLGAVLVDPVTVPTGRDFGALPGLVMRYEFKAGLNAYLARLNFPIRTLADVIAFNLAHAREERLDFFDQDVLIECQNSGPLSEPKYHQALEAVRRRARQDGLDLALQSHRLDAIVSPTNGPAWLIDDIDGDHFGGGSAPAAALAGYPHITVPAGTVHDLPVGLSFYGAAFSEPRLLALAYAYEQATHHIRAPRL